MPKPNQPSRNNPKAAPPLRNDPAAIPFRSHAERIETLEAQVAALSGLLENLVNRLSALSTETGIEV